MGFENPAWLWGAFAAAIPLVLHLIARRRAKVHEFAAIEFILASNKRIARRFKLKQWLLLLARMLLLAAVPIAFAKPFTITTEESLPATGAPGSVVLVIDPSFSMGYMVGEETLLDRAREKAKAIVADLRNESDAAVVVAGSPARALTQQLTYDRQELRHAVEAIEPEHGSADIQGALRLAEQILVQSGQPRREVVLLTDLQATEWQGITRPWSLDHAPKVTLLDMRPPDVEHENGAITAVVAEPEAGGMGRDVRITVEVLNDRPKTFEDVVTVKVAGKTAKGIVKVPPGQTISKEFTIRLSEAGAVSGTVEIPTDRLPGDNVHPFVIDFLRRVHVLVVNGSPATVPHSDETFFLRAALRPGRETASRINPTFVKPDELTPAQLSYVDVVVLANVAELEEAQAMALSRWVSQGGGLLVTGGENVTPDAYGSAAMRDLVPLPVRDIKSAEEQPLFLTAVETTHPLLGVFAHIPDASLFTARTDRFVLLETAALAGTHVLASYTDGSPALVERQVGAGRLVMLTTTIDRDWTDLPFKTSFLPLIQQTVLYLGGKLERPSERSLVVGATRTIPVGRDDTSIEVLRPDGEVFQHSGPDLAAGEVRFHETRVAGIYRVQHLRPQGVEEERFAVHVEPAESALGPADRAAIETLLDSKKVTGDGAIAATEKAPRRTGEVWPMILIGLFFLLGFETWLAFASG